MASAYIYQFAKRHNSTAVPTSGTAIDVQLKGGTDLNEPVFLFAYDDSLGLPSMSMIQFGDKYYFVDSIRSVRDNLYEVSCSVDVLATYKTEILAASAYVLYYNHANSELTDKRLGIKTTKAVQSASGNFSILGTGGRSDSVVIVTAVGKDRIASYALTQADAKGLTSNLDNWYSDNNVLGPRPAINSFTDVLEALSWGMNALWELGKQRLATRFVPDCIKSAILLPIPASAISGANEAMWLGDYPAEAAGGGSIIGARLVDRILIDSVTVSIPWQATDWRRNSPFHEIYIYIPYVGLINLSPSDVIGYSDLTVTASMDLTSGDTIFCIRNGSHIFGQYGTNLASSYPIGSSNVSPAQTTNSIIAGALGAAGAFFTGGATAILAGTAGALGMVNNLTASPSSIGSNYGGAILGYPATVICFTVFHDTIQAPGTIRATAGEPYMGVMALASITGYVQTLAASVSGSMTDDERAEINRLLDGGIYIE